jgi:hypothetical protein
MRGVPGVRWKRRATPGYGAARVSARATPLPARQGSARTHSTFQCRAHHSMRFQHFLLIGTLAVPALLAPALRAGVDDKSTNPPAAAPARSFLQEHFRLSLITTAAFGGSTADPAELAVGGHDPNQEWANLQSVEGVLGFEFDPYIDGSVVAVGFLDEDDQIDGEIEEAYARIKAIPGGFTLKGGRFLAEYGRINRQHLHQWSTVDYPLANGRFLGEHGLQGDGGQVSWLLPLPVYSEVFLGAVQVPSDEHDHAEEGDDHGHSLEAHDANFADGALSARWVLSHDLTETHTLTGGVSYAIGENNFGGSRDTQVFGADLYFRWKPARTERGFPFVSWHTEVLYRKVEAVEEAEEEDYEHEHEQEQEHDGEEDHHEEVARALDLDEIGIHSEVNWGFRTNWVASLRGDWVSGIDEFGEEGGERWRVSPALTWHLKEHTHLRVQYNLDWGNDTGTDHSVWLQVGVALGPHGGHSY